MAQELDCGSAPQLPWRLTFPILAISQFWAVASGELRLLDPGLAKVLAGVQFPFPPRRYEHGGGGTGPCHLPLPGSGHLPHRPFLHSLSSGGWPAPWEGREETGRLGAGGSRAATGLSHPGADGNNTARAPGDLALGESRQILELLFPPTCRG